MKSFEERLSRLEQLAEKLKAGGVELEEAVALFEEGIRLARDLSKELGKVERKVQILLNEPGRKGSAVEEPDLGLFPEGQEDSPA
jgi:exodeoxyribonuclease VII small subunit